MIGGGGGASCLSLGLLKERWSVSVDGGVLDGASADPTQCWHRFFFDVRRRPSKWLRP